jgi:hypothetical protein
MLVTVALIQLMLVTVALIQLKFGIWIYNEKIQAKFEFGYGAMIFDKVKFSVSVHYLPNGITHSIQISNMDTSKKWTGQIRMWSWFNDFWQSYAPFTLKII